jgi:D-alanyl-D-alanine carboxypeptidase
VVVVMLRPLWLAILLVTACTVFHEDTLNEQLDAMFRDAYPTTDPGAAVIVIKEGETLLRKGYGMADIEHGVHITPQTVFPLAGLTTQFTAFAILLLEEEGILRTEDPLTRFFPEYPMGDDTIRVAHLLAHTSGISNYAEATGFWERMWDYQSPSDVIEFFEARPLEFSPGERTRYSDSGYFLLGYVVENLSGRPYEEFIRDRILKPLDMHGSYYASHERVIPNRAAAYLRYDEDLYNAEPVNPITLYAAAGLMSTVDDLAKWDAALSSEMLVAQEALERYFRRFDLNSGESGVYAHGWACGELQGRPMRYNIGFTNGSFAAVVRLPLDQTYAAVLANIGRPVPSSLYMAQKAASLVLGKPLQEWTEVSLSVDILDQYVGVYRIDENTVRYVTREGNQLYTRRQGWFRLNPKPASRTEFFFPNSASHFEFVLDEKGEVAGMMMYFQTGLTEWSTRTNEPLPERPQALELDPAILAGYTGRYELESGMQFAITLDVMQQQLAERSYGLLHRIRFPVYRARHRLRLTLPRLDPVEIHPESESKFFSRELDAELSFTRGDNGSVQGVRLTRGGVAMRGRKLRTQ